MHTGRKLAIAIALVSGVTGYMAYVGASGSWQYYVTAEECVADASRLAGHRIRVSGTIVPRSLLLGADRRHADFVLASGKSDLPVVCSGEVPDNLSDAMDVVVEGRLDGERLFRADKVITRCASKYRSEGATAGGPVPLAARPERTR